MALATFALFIDADYITGAVEKTATITLKLQGTTYLIDGTQFRTLAPLSAGAPVSLPYTVSLPTDVATGGTPSTAIGYAVTLTTAFGTTIKTSFAARAAGSTLNLAAVTAAESVDISATLNDGVVSGLVNDPASATRSGVNSAADVRIAAKREQANGVAGLDAAGLLYPARIPDLSATYARTPTNSARAVGKGELTFNVLDYGAVSGGSGDDTTAFQAAVNAAAATPVSLGAEVFIPPGDYRIANVIVPDRVKIRGAGQRASRVEATASGVAMELGKENVLSDFYLTGTTIAGGTGIRFRTNSLHSTLRDMTITGHVYGVTIDNSFVVQIRDSQIQSCTNGLYITGTVGCNIVLVNGGEVQGCTNGVVIDGANNYGLKFLGTTVEGNSGKGFAVNGATYGLSIRDCYMEGNTNGHIFFGGSGHFGTVISGNHISRAGAFGVNVPAGLNVRDITIEGNSFEMTAAGAKSIYLGSGVIVAHVGKNYYYTASIGNFDPAVDFLGNRLIYTDQGRLNLRPSFASQSSGGAPLNIPHGTAPTNPVNGDIWTTTAGLYVRINGATVGPLT